VTVVVVTFVRPHVSHLGQHKTLPDVCTVLSRKPLPTQLLQLALKTHHCAFQNKPPASVREFDYCNTLLIYRDPIPVSSSVRAFLSVYLPFTATASQFTMSSYLNPLTPTVAIMGRPTAIKHPVPDRVKQSCVIFDIRAL